jgi:hypothetical protein
MVGRGAPLIAGRSWHGAMCRRLPVHRRQDFRDDGYGGTEKLQPPLQRKTCHLFLDFIDEGMQGENLRVSFGGREMGSGGGMLTEKVARQLIEGLRNRILSIRENRLRAAPSASRDACCFLVLIVAQCAMLSCLVFDGFLHPAAREYPEIHGVYD